jgi:hypothetical protein
MEKVVWIEGWHRFDLTFMMDAVGEANNGLAASF